MTSSLDQPVQCRQFSGIDQRLEKPPVGAIKPDDDGPSFSRRIHPANGLIYFVSTNER
jgi:hypothetical protein